MIAKYIFYQVELKNNKFSKMEKYKEFFAYPLYLILIVSYFNIDHINKRKFIMYLIKNNES